MKIVFFGDFHFANKQSTGGLHIEYPNPVSDDPLERLIDSLKMRYEKEKISLMVFLGDYGKGKDSEDDKTAVFKRIDSFVKKVEDECCDIFDNSTNLKDRIIFLDGNHDVTRDKEHHKIFEAVFGAYLTPFTAKSGNGARKYGAPVFDFPDLDLLFAGISTTQNAGAYFEQSNLAQITELIAPLQDIENYGKLVKLFETKNVDIGSVTPDVIHLLKKNSKKKGGKVRIVASHHPLIQMQHATASHFETVNGPLFFDSARANGYTYFVSGHLHEFYCADITSRGKSSFLPSATLISVPTFINADNNEARFVELDIQEDMYSCRLLAYSSIRDMFEEIDVASNDSRIRPDIQREHTLLDYEIQSLIEVGEVVKNGSTDRVQAVSYDCALGLSYKRYDEQNNTWPDEAIVMEECQDGPAKICIEPGERVLLYTHEEFNIPPNMMLQASPRASWNRKGISVDLSFIVEPGFDGPFCFPVTNKNKHAIEINAQESVMSVTFHMLSHDVCQGWRDRAPESLKKRKNKQDK